jgi:hypothetical protein
MTTSGCDVRSGSSSRSTPAWAVEPIVPAGSVVPAMRLLVARGFARYMAGIDPRTEVPPTELGHRWGDQRFLLLG